MTPEQVEALDLLRAHVLAGAYLIADRAPRPCRIDHIIDALLAEAERVQGNRPAGSLVTWDDMRLCLVATLRRALGILGEEVTP